MKPLAYSYIRFSSPEQARGDSYRRQREAAEAYCKENGLELAAAKEYKFFDAGRSAYKGKHVDDTGELKRFLGYVEDGTIKPGSYLLVESLDRLSREKVRDALPRFLDLLAKGINIYTSADRRLYTKDFNDIDLIVSIVSMSRAHEESSVKGMRVSKAWRQKRDLARTEKKPLGAACPYWLELKDGVYQPIKTRVEVIERIFREAIEGRGQVITAKRLNADGVPVFGSTTGKNGSKPRNQSGTWGTSSVAKILDNRAVLGEYQPMHFLDGVRQNDGEAVEGFYPRVIDEEVFLRAQAARAQRKRYSVTKQATEFNIWQGLAKCRLCGDALHLINKGKPPKGYKYLWCHSAKKGSCTGGMIRAEYAETVFKEVLAKVDAMSLVHGRSAEIHRSLEAAEGQLAIVASRLEQAIDAHTEFPSKPSAQLLQALELEHEQHTSKRDELRQQLASSRVISKDDFFQRLDLVSYEGRAAANSLLKRLGILVQFQRYNPNSFTCWVLDTTYESAANDFDGQLFGIKYLDGAVEVQAMDDDIWARQVEQGELDPDRAEREQEEGISWHWFSEQLGRGGKIE
ncbi:recombinase family protein [Pseudomonas sp. BN606]|uniref:recombinase family protein n=1 Tax=Pseudomonas sp. BN606 TaxID=2567894 RepID=UPI002453A2E8|nr:recombinase family protein [Pseudomonas sp. BN606]MDH4656024.1 recombinase family protein [Pseudomonas sp. BN606]